MLPPVSFPRGELHDPYKEFMVNEDQTISKEALAEDFNAHYWDCHYTLREEHVPRMIRPFATRALVAGKYFNVLRDRETFSLLSLLGVAVVAELSGHDISNSSSIENKSSSNNNTLQSSSVPAASVQGASMSSQQVLRLSLELSGDNALARAVDASYNFSSRALLQQLDGECGLHSHLKSLRRFFLLENGDFFTQFMDIAEAELHRDVKDISLARIQGLLQQAVHTSTVSLDPNKEELTCTLASHNLIQHLNLIQVRTVLSEPSAAALYHINILSIIGVVSCDYCLLFLSVECW